MRSVHSYRRCLQRFVPLFAVVLAVVTSPALADGTVRAWGYDAYGQCTIPSDLGVCTQIAGGSGHTVALRADGTVRAWGYNQYGQCNIPSDLGACTQIAGGTFHTVALRADGTVRAWGYNQWGQCNIPSDLGACTQIAGGYGHTIATAPGSKVHAQCPGDFNGDQVRDGLDLATLLTGWGGPNGDCNADGMTDGVDLSFILSGWGACPVPTWATVLEWNVNPAVVTNATLRTAITATGWPWRVKDTGTNIEMLLIPPGSFTMGCTPSVVYGCYSSENPTHAVTLTSAFYLARYEVTQAQWTAKMGSNPSWFQGASYPDAAYRPVEQVSWNMIASFNTATGMRLPTEAEWEFAYRAQLGTSVTRTAFHNGSNDDALLGDIAWYDLNSGSQTHAVGGKTANALGLHDMSGNVWEWCNDWYGNTYYSSSPSTNPQGPSSETNRVVRGGAWDYSSGGCRGSQRFNGSPDSAGNFVGFRSARTP